MPRRDRPKPASRASVRPLALAVALGLAGPAAAQQPGPSSQPAPDSQPASQPLGKCSKRPSTLNTPRPTSADDVPVDPDLREIYFARKRFEAEALEYRGDIHALITGEYAARQKALSDGYDEILNRKGASEEELRSAAIAYFEEFVAQYPDQVEYTPSALYRLAELYFERDNIAYLKADAEYQDKLISGESVDYAPPLPDYTKSIQTFAALINKFPQYKLIDGAYYLLGYCLTEMGGYAEALTQLQTLTRDYPTSKFAPEASLRIGELLFAQNEYAGALDAYAKVASAGEASPFYDKALYKLGWSHYRLAIKVSRTDPSLGVYHFDQSVKRFRELLDFHAAGKGGDTLIAEARQYLKIDLAEDWNGDGFEDWLDDPTQRPVERAKRYLDAKQPYTQLVLVDTADQLIEQRFNGEAIAVLRYAVDTYPDNPQNPELLTRIVEALERDGKSDEALAVREEIGRRFGKGSEWAALQDDPTREAAEALAEDALIRSATKHHEKGQKLRLEWQETQEAALLVIWQEEYRVAAGLYQSYLAQYSTSSNAYELGYYFAECLFYSSRFVEASEQYEKVRDSRLSDLYFEDAAYSSIVSLENQIKTELDQNPEAYRTSPPPVGAGGELYPPLLVKLQANRDYFSTQIPIPCEKSYNVAEIRFNAALTAYNYGQFDDARRRFVELIETSPKEAVSRDAAKLYVDTFRLQNDLIGQKEASDKYLSLDLGPSGGAPDPKVQDQRFVVDYQYALALLEQGKNDEAATILATLIEQRPDWELKYKAMNDAAVAFERAKRYDSATKYFERLVNEDPKGEFAANALYRVGINAERFFEFDKAVSSYLKLLSTYKTFSEEKRLGALLAVAKIKDDNREYADAAKYYEQAHDEFLSTKVSEGASWNPSAALFKAAEVRQKGGLLDPAVKSYNRYLSLYRDKAHADQSLEAYMKIAEIQEAKGKHKDALKTYEQVVDAFDTFVLPQGGRGAELAAKARFFLIEEGLPTYERIGFKFKDPKKAEKGILDKISGLKALKKSYEEVAAKYKSPTYSLAALYRIGYLYENLADTFYASNPFKEGSLEYDSYQIQIEDQAIKAEDEAVKNYKIAYDKGKELKIENEWTRQALEHLNKYRGSTEYPLPKPPRTKITEDAALGAGEN